MKTIYQLLIIILLTGLINCTKESAFVGGNTTGASGSTARFTTSGNYLYVVDNVSLKSFDISNNTNPVYKSKTDIGINIETIFPYKDKLFIGSSSSMYIYSLADPARPVRIAKAEYTIRMACDPVVAKDNVAYATLRANGSCGGGISALVVYNITDIADPKLETTIPLSGPYGLGLKDNSLYVCEGPGGIKVFNITSIYNPIPGVILTAAGTSFYDVIPYGNVLIAQVNDGFILYDLSVNPHQPTFLSRIQN